MAVPRLVGHALKAGHPSNRQQRKVGRGNTEGTRSQCVAKLVQQHASEQREDEQHSRDGGGRAAEVIVRKSNPSQKKKEGEMDTNFVPAIRAIWTILRDFERTKINVCAEFHADQLSVQCQRD